MSSKYRYDSKALTTSPFFTDGGLETTLCYLDGIDLPHFAAFNLLNSSDGREALIRYFKSYGELSAKYKENFWLEAPTWRANKDWSEKLGFTEEQLKEMILISIDMLVDIRTEYESVRSNNVIVISGCIGPRGDGYVAEKLMSSMEAMEYHMMPINAFSETSTDVVSAITMTYTEEAIGIALAAKSVNMPVVIAFTVETNGALPSGQSLEDAITQVDSATDSYPSFYMINCAHPEHFQSVLQIAENQGWVSRVHGLRVNASRLSHADLDSCTSLDDGNPVELAAEMKILKSTVPSLRVFGGCCGTDVRHIEAMVIDCGGNGTT